MRPSSTARLTAVSSVAADVDPRAGRAVEPDGVASKPARSVAPARRGTPPRVSAPSIGRAAPRRPGRRRRRPATTSGASTSSSALQVAARGPRRGTARRPPAARSRSTCIRGRRAATCSRARWAIWRTAAGDLPTASAISSYGMSNTSRSTNTARSAGAERLEHGEHRDRDALGELDVVGDVGAGEQRLGQPLADVVLAPPRQRPQPVERLPGDDPDEVGARVAHLGLGRRRPTAATSPARRPRRRRRSRASRRRR